MSNYAYSLYPANVLFANDKMTTETVTLFVVLMSAKPKNHMMVL